MAVVLASDEASEASGQVFGTRLNEIYLYEQAYPKASVHRSDGWTPDKIAEHAVPALKRGFVPLVPSLQYFTWEPI
jgi:hypothetical protein